MMKFYGRLLVALALFFATIAMPSLSLVGCAVSSSQAQVDVRSYGAKGDGTTNDTSAIQAAYNALPSGGVLVFPVGTFVCNTLAGSKSVTIQGTGINSTVLKRTSGSAAVIDLSGSTTRFLIRDLTVDGSNIAAQGIKANGIDTLTADNILVKNCGTPGFASGGTGSVDGIYLSNVTVANINRCTFDTIERDGVLGIPAKHLTVTNSRMTNCGRFAAANEQNAGLTSGPDTVVYTNNYAEKCRSGGFHTETHSSLPRVRMQAIANTVKNCGWEDWSYSWGIVAGRRVDGLISNNHIENLGQPPSWVATTAYAVGDIVWSTNSRAYRCTIAGTSGASAPSHTSGSAADGGVTWLHVGTLATNYRSGIILNSGIVTANRILNSGRNGINGDTMDDRSVIADNYIGTCGNIGIYVYNTNDVSLTNNVIEGAAAEGINARLAGRLQVVGNRLRNNATANVNTRSALKLELSVNGVITGNLFEGTNHKYSIEFDSPHLYPGGFTIGGNKYVSAGTAWSNIAASLTGGEIEAGRRRMIGTAIPTDGYWGKGDVVENKDADPGEAMGWMPTAVGTRTDTAWLPSTVYTVGQYVYNGGSVYRVTVAGTSAASGGPTGTGSAIADNTVTWEYISLRLLSTDFKELAPVSL